MRARAAVSHTQTKLEVSAGGVLFLAGHRDTVVLLHHRHGTWVMPKGHVEAGEPADQAAVREVREETGLHAQIVDKVGSTRYIFHAPWEVLPIEKTVHWYLMEVSDPRPVLEPWFDRLLLLHGNDALDTLTYHGDRSILRQALRLRHQPRRA